MSGTFTLTIELGNEAMQTPGDVARALRRVDEGLQECDSFEYTNRGRIADLNGNTVGTWRYAP